MVLKRRGPFSLKTDIREVLDEMVRFAIENPVPPLDRQQGEPLQT